MSLERAIELAERGRGTTHPNPVVGAVIARDGEVVGEGWHQRAGGPHAEIVALESAAERARGATVYVSLEPCAARGRTPACTEALLAAGVAHVVVGSRDPDPRMAGGVELLRDGGVDVELAGGAVAFEARAQNEAWRTWVERRRPFVTYKAAVTLDGRMTVAGARWVSGEESRLRVHELRARSGAVAVGMGTVRADAPLLTAREVGAVTQPRRIAFGKGPLPEGSDLELRAGPLLDELEALAEEGVQSLLLEGGPTLAGAFIAEDLVDKLLLFVAPTLAGEGPTLIARALPEPVRLERLTAEQVGEDVLLTAYIHAP